MFEFLSRKNRKIPIRRVAAGLDAPEALEVRLALSTTLAALPVETSLQTSRPTAAATTPRNVTPATFADLKAAAESKVAELRAAAPTVDLQAAESKIADLQTAAGSKVVELRTAAETRVAELKAAASASMGRAIPQSQDVASAIAGAIGSTIVMQSASTSDSKSVSVRYDVGDFSLPGQPLTFGVYRSADAVLDASDVLLTQYQAPAGSRAPGSHELTIPVEGGLPIDVARPYVLVVADPDGAGATDPDHTASFRKFSIGVVSHGGIINQSWTYGSPWQLQIGRLMEEEGYDAVIPFNWIRESHQEGHAAPQGLRVVNQIQKLLDQLPTDTVVDLHYIGHSQGAVVGTVALARLQEETPVQLKGGWIKETMLDPHAANNYVPGQMSTSNSPVGVLARMIVSGYQATAKDPTVYVPNIVDEAEVIYQHTNISDVHQISASGYNLWGQVPVPNQSDSPIQYYNLTRTSATHSGATGVQFWYRNFIATTLSEQTPLLTDLRLTAGLADASPTTWIPETDRDQRALANWGPDQLIVGRQPTFTGTSAPGASVIVYVGPTADLTRVMPAVKTTADAQGNWSVSTNPNLADGRYRAVAMAYSPEHHTRPAYAVVSMAPMGRFWVGGDPRA